MRKRHPIAMAVVTALLILCAMFIHSGEPTVTYCDVFGGWPGVGNINADPKLLDPAGDDFRLRSDSPCIDKGDPTFDSLGQDLEGIPRVLDGKLLGVRRVDMGAHEFTHVRLAVSEPPSRSSVPRRTSSRQLVISSTGTLGLPAFLIAGLARDERLLEPFGPLFIDLGAPSWICTWPRLPSTVWISVPRGMPSSVRLTLQQLALHPTSRAGNFSSAADVLLGVE
ncbi:MAG: choice-of-anchor Q domain-containing protein [Planctomycetota bacterium]